MRDRFVGGSVIVLFTLLLLFVVWPVFSTFKLSLTADGAFSLVHYLSIFEKSWLRTSLLNSLQLGVISASISCVIGYLFAFLIARTRVKAKTALRFFATLPIISPPFMLSLSVILMLGKNGFVTKMLGLEDFSIYGLPGLVLVQSLSLFPLAYLTILGVLQGIDGAIEDAALDLGASRFKTFWDITLPLSLPGIFSAWLLVFVTSLADFATPMLLSGKYDVLSVQAYLQFTGSGNLPLGAALSNLLLIPCVGAYLLQKYYVQKKAVITVSGKPQRTGRELTSKPVRFILGFIASLICLSIFVLYGTVLAGCFTKSWGLDYSFSLENFDYIWKVGGQTIIDTLLLSAIATPIAGALGLLIAFLVVRKKFMGRKFLDTLAIFPFALPGTAVGIGYVLAFNEHPLLLTGTALIIILAFVFRNMPVAIESAKASLIQIDHSIEEAATNLGASTQRVFWEITLPMIKPAIFTGMAYVFVHCMTAVSAVIFIVSANWKHMTVLTLAQTEMLRFSAAAVLCLILIVLVLLVFGLIKMILGKNLLAKEIIE